MAATYGSIHVLCDEPVSIAFYDFASWAPGWQTMIPTEANREMLTDPEASARKAKAISKLLGKTVLWFFLFDEDVVSFALFSEGKTLAAHNAFSSDKNISKIPALVGINESYRKRLSKILSCTDTDIQIKLLEEFFGVKLLLFPEMLEEDSACAVCGKGSALFEKYESENRAPTGKKSPIQVKRLFELEGVLSDSDWNNKYHQADGCLWVFQKHYWLYSWQKATGEEEKPVCFRAGRLDFISDAEMLQLGTDQQYNETRNKDPLYEQLFFPNRILFSENAPEPYRGKTIRHPDGFYGLGFDGKGRFLLFNEASCFAWMDQDGKLLAKQNVKGHIIDHDGDFLLTWEEKWDRTERNGKPFPTRWYGMIRGYRLFDK